MAKEYVWKEGEMLLRFTNCESVLKYKHCMRYFEIIKDLDTGELINGSTTNDNFGEVYPDYKQQEFEELTAEDVLSFFSNQEN